MKIVADLHLHSKYSRAVSKEMNLESMAKMAEIKGINLLSTGDFTYPEWFDEIKEKLVEDDEGIYRLKADNSSETRYILGGEISSIYTQGGKGRRIHNIVLAPNFSLAEKLNQELVKAGCNLKSDGRPIIGLSAIELCQIIFSVSENFIVIPAHIWTPWFGILGSKSGFDSLRECYGEYAEKIFAIETGLSSDPDMNWQIEELDRVSVVSFSDAHSPAKLGRELTVLEGDGKFNFLELKKALAKKGNFQIKETIEFYPEEGKYHVDGHRNCGVWQDPKKTAKVGRTCPVCGKTLTLGVMGRVTELTRENKVKVEKEDSGELVYYRGKGRVSYIKTVPLLEIIAEALEKGTASKVVQKKYKEMIDKFGNELGILTEIKIKEIKKWDNWIGEAIEKVRKGDIYVKPGYDGVFGKVKIWRDEMAEIEDKGEEQMSLF